MSKFLSRADIELAREQLVREIIDECRDEVTLLTPPQVMGLLNVNHSTLSKMKGLPRVELIAKRVIRYRLADVRAKINASLTD